MTKANAMTHVSYKFCLSVIPGNSGLGPRAFTQDVLPDHNTGITPQMTHEGRNKQQVW